MKRSLSGIQASGSPHIGNYLGSMKNCIKLQDTHQSIIFIADLHAITTVRDAQQLNHNIHEMVLDYLALGLNPEKTIFFRQSSVPEHSELCWIFSCITPFGLMERAHAWKDAYGKQTKEPTVGLFTYPILMAADILLYNPDLVPVGKDQKQHIEIARDIAEKFNHHFGETFQLPQEYTPEEIATIPGTDGEKMSKSYGNTIDIFADEKTLRKQVMSIKTDSIPIEQPINPDNCNVFNIYQFFANSGEIENLRDQYRAGGFGYGNAKQALLTKLHEYFAQAREKRAQLAKNPDHVKDILNQGAQQAKTLANQTLSQVKEKVGLIY